MERIDSWSRKKYLVLTPPSEEDNCPYQERILRELEPEFGKIHTELCVLRQLSAVCEQADWKITAVLSWDGKRWLPGRHRGRRYQPEKLWDLRRSGEYHHRSADPGYGHGGSAGRRERF